MQTRAKLMGRREAVKRGGLLAGAIVLSGHAATTIEFPHPPTFSDFRKTWNIAKEEERIDAQVEFFKAAMFSSGDIRKIRLRKGKQELVGAGVQGKFDDDIPADLLRKAAALDPKNPMIWAALSFRLLAETQRSETAFGEAFSAVDHLTEVDPDNKLARYIRAALLAKQKKFSGSAQALSSATECRTLNTYMAEMRRCVIVACEAVGFSKFTARLVACGATCDVVTFSTIGKAVAEHEEFDVGSSRECLQMGRRMEKESSTFLEELVAFSVQVKALKKLNDPELVTVERQQKERREAIKRYDTILESKEAHSLPEKTWVEYYDRMYEAGEGRAVEWLSERIGKKS